MSRDALDNEANWPYHDDERLQEKARKVKFEAEHCMYSSGEGMGPPGCCLAPKLFGRACSKHITFSLDEVTALGQRMIAMMGLTPSASVGVLHHAIASVLNANTIGPVPTRGSKTEASALFHNLWTKDVGTKGYEKEKWKKLEKALFGEGPWQE